MQNRQSLVKIFPTHRKLSRKTYAAGRIPGGYFKREGRPSEKETLTSRLIDRPIRPLFPEGFLNEVQVTAQVISTDKSHDPDIAAILGTSAALAISGIPFNGYGGIARGLCEWRIHFESKLCRVRKTELDLVVAGTEKAVLMVESEAKELSEDEMLGAVLFGHDEMQVAIAAIKAFAAEVGNARWEWAAPAKNEALKAELKSAFEAAVSEAYLIREKQVRYGKLDEIKQQALVRCP